MSSTLLNFKDKYYIYDGDLAPDDRGLTIGGYESAWLADLTITFVLERARKDIFLDFKYFSVYRDDGIGIFNKKLNELQLNDWLLEFQTEVNEICGNECFKVHCNPLGTYRH